MTPKATVEASERARGLVEELASADLSACDEAGDGCVTQYSKAHADLLAYLGKLEAVAGAARAVKPGKQHEFDATWQTLADNLSALDGKAGGGT